MGLEADGIRGWGMACLRSGLVITLRPGLAGEGYMQLCRPHSGSLAEKSLWDLECLTTAGHALPNPEWRAQLPCVRCKSLLPG